MGLKRKALSSEISGARNRTIYELNQGLYGGPRRDNTHNTWKRVAVNRLPLN
jgi:hypothetical protein